MSQIRQLHAQHAVQILQVELENIINEKSAQIDIFVKHGIFKLCLQLSALSYVVHLHYTSPSLWLSLLNNNN